ncbi:hypothetical protein Daura_13430 [Dactylosporangium aurantiacum]|uniref:Uncharacterized protein n=1 Tax=Dactylosporangium aurantiacum TaxID=35754 RepID=A0A9Q9MPZ8_9ACTN|nr:hypothetical protein [Dactylosporangium aurantiacum]MDG6105587.1 hypothetical protein [Dactylosporangium aurantiacum]UWZ57072.1 hypothetical protein Daura_13430 [Dactylosporangium aurantiacum]
MPIAEPGGATCHHSHTGRASLHVAVMTAPSRRIQKTSRVSGRRATDTIVAATAFAAAAGCDEPLGTAKSVAHACAGAGGTATADVSATAVTTAAARVLPAGAPPPVAAGRRRGGHHQLQSNMIGSLRSMPMVAGMATVLVDVVPAAGTISHRPVKIFWEVAASGHRVAGRTGPGAARRGRGSRLEHDVAGRYPAERRAKRRGGHGRAGADRPGG